MHAKERKKKNCSKPAKYKTVRKAFTSLTIPQRSRHFVDDLPAKQEFGFGVAT